MIGGKEKFSHNASSYLISIVLVLTIVSVLILTQGSNPIEVSYKMVNGALGSTSAIVSSIRWNIPVIISSMAAVVAQESGINNLGIEGQVYFGALTPAIVGVYVWGLGYVVVPLTALAGATISLLCVVVPATLEVYWNIDGMITTPMFNYAVVQVTEYLTMMIMGLSGDTNPNTIVTPEIQENARLARIMPPYQASTDIFIGLGTTVVIFTLYEYTRVGYEWKVTGRNRIFAKCGGTRHLKNYFAVFLCSNAITGVRGAVKILGLRLRFRTNFSSNMGWGGIMVALVAKNNPMATMMVAIIWGIIKADSISMERITGVSRVLVTLVQALSALFIMVDFRTIFQRALKKRNAKEG